MTGHLTAAVWFGERWRSGAARGCGETQSQERIPGRRVRTRTLSRRRPRRAERKAQWPESLFVPSPPFRGRASYLRLLFNLSAPALSIWIAANIFLVSSGIRPLAHEPVQITELVVRLLLVTVAHFVLNSPLTAIAFAFEKDTSPVAISKQNFVWLTPDYFGGRRQPHCWSCTRAILTFLSWA